jgi:hypothetical protein
MTAKPRLRRHRGRAIDPAVQDAIEELALRGYTSVQIRETLSRDTEYAWIETTPPIYTIRRIVRDQARDQAFDDFSGTWSPLPGVDPPASRVVLDVLASVITHTAGKVRVLTIDEALWIAALANATFGLGSWERYRLAREYLRRSVEGRPTNDLDILLAFRPWASGEASRRYLAVTRADTRPRGWRSFVIADEFGGWDDEDEGGD